MKGWVFEPEGRFELVDREEWGAEEPCVKVPLYAPINNIIFVFNSGTKHCTLQDKCCKILKNLQEQEMKKMGEPDLKYNYFIGGDGRLYEGRGWQVAGCAPNKYYTLERKSISFAFLGDFRRSDPSFLMWAAAFKFLGLAIHSDVVSTLAPNEVVSRGRWRARAPKFVKDLRIPVTNVLLSYFSYRETPLNKHSCVLALKEMQRRHMKRGLEDIPYHFMICRKGTIFEGRGWTLRCPAPWKYIAISGKCFSIAFIGNYLKEEPRMEMFESALRIIKLGVEKQIIAPHYDIITYKGDH